MDGHTCCLNRGPKSLTAKKGKGRIAWGLNRFPELIRQLLPFYALLFALLGILSNRLPDDPSRRRGRTAEQTTRVRSLLRLEGTLAEHVIRVGQWCRAGVVISGQWASEFPEREEKKPRERKFGRLEAFSLNSQAPSPGSKK
ncbi:hypothetical protein MTO96_002673 [Rhipicephalus appendiculatus]